MIERPALFISHANPEDNRFTVWLGAKLASLGYEVWADVMKLRGGDDWQRKLEKALRERAHKVLLVANPVSVDKQGVRNEIQIATEVAKEIKDGEFIIPLSLEKFKPPFLIAHAQYIDFSKSWFRGLRELLETLDERKVPKSGKDGAHIWREIQLIHGKELVKEPETLVSNWLRIEALPAFVRLYDFRGGISVGQSKARMADAPWPVAEYKRGFLTFAPLHNLQDHFGPSLPLVLLAEKNTKDFIDEGWGEHDVEPWMARNYFSDLSRQALDRMLKSRQLTAFELANNRLAWWGSYAIVPKNKIAFKWHQISGLRQIQGVSVKRKMNWHYGISATTRIKPLPHIRVTGRLIFTPDGAAPFDVVRMHRLRRSFAKAWRNARWRDMMLAFLWWVADGKSSLVALVSADEGIIINLPPMTFDSPVSLLKEGLTELGDDDDPSDDESDSIDEVERDEASEDWDDNE